ncbi:pyridine nucleotide-disulfide oxidoreductase [Rhizobium sp. Leaf384]|uniref:NAD(P)/FAD-dependent oxidoreductase n=1 Tax=unclassified Rhizobium TaxID=2613769 RepID=UPI000713109E|nr:MULTISPECIES: NAD(P)/FAD-dependent oxidoreductase [unclassified Rhizobium]KQS81276.1 pyridine nucleotide-disulfide oxidoreductase [Rhizobium sp. Leaf384]KQS87184.1 pyridine nucleotide-disulfide oxidoreductase [Rhizobium sp. Leaf383]
MNVLEEADLARALPRRRVVIIGAGFGGLACAGALGHAEVDVVVIDRRNHNLFQPLLYQVATAALSPADIAEPIRRTLGRYRNIHIMLAEAHGIDTQTKRVMLKDGNAVAYDQLVIATGSEYNYFGHDEWQRFAPGLKTLHEARRIRHRLLLAFEKAEQTKDPAERRALLTSIVVGGGPTGVEMAGAISELGRSMASRDFRTIPLSDLRVILVEAGPRILSAFPEHLQTYALGYLEKIGVDVRLGAQVSDITMEGAVIAGEMVPAGNIVWGAGVKASPASRWLGLEGKANGRIPVDSKLRVEGYEDIFSLGDTSVQSGDNGAPLPALAQVAKQQGHYLGKLLAKIDTIENAKPFYFNNRGNTAVIGRNAAIFDFGRWTLKGYLAWILWAIVHVYLLVNFEKRMLVTLQWIWRYLTRQRGARLIDENDREDVLPAARR